jgi:hypothetical protein
MIKDGKFSGCGVQHACEWDLTTIGGSLLVFLTLVESYGLNLILNHVSFLKKRKIYFSH